MKRLATSFICIGTLIVVSLVFPYFEPARSLAEAGSHPGSPFLGVNPVVINEIDYDQVGTDSAEFVELKNVSASPINLDNYSLELVNGSGGGAAIYDTIDLPNVNLAAGDYYVICANNATVINCDLDDGPDTDFIQNGAPDAVGLRLSGSLVDAVSYEGNTGAPYTETAGTPAATASDSNTIGFIGLSRFPDGTDTNNNAVDLSLRCISPGRANVATTTGCFAPTAAAVSISGRVTTATGRGISKVRVTLTSPDGSVTMSLTNPFGYYSFEGVAAGQTYLIAVSAKGRQFSDPVRMVNLDDAIFDLDFVANE